MILVRRLLKLQSAVKEGGGCVTMGRAAPLHLVLICLVVVWVSSKVALLVSSAVSRLTGVWL